MKYLIIGASSGLGRELANIFAQKKNDLIIVSRDKRDLDALKSDLEIKYHVNVETIELDFSSLEEINEKLLSKNQILENLQGALFPVGMMFDEDNLSMNSEKIQILVFFLIPSFQIHLVAQISPATICAHIAVIPASVAIPLEIPAKKPSGCDPLFKKSTRPDGLINITRNQIIIGPIKKNGVDNNLFVF